MARRPSTAITAVPAAAATAATKAQKADASSEYLRTRANPNPMSQPHRPPIRIATKANALAAREGSAESAVRPGIGGIPSNPGVTGSGTSKIVDSSLVRTLVVLPTFNERENIEEVLQRVRASVPQAQIVVVDDASPDGTADAAEATATALGQIGVICRGGKGGLGSAYRHGFAYGMEAGFEIMVEMDSDLSHDPAALPALLAAVEQGADLSIGSRYVPGGAIPDWRWHRRLLSRWGNRYASVVLGLAVRDATSGYRAYRTEMLQRIDLASVHADGYAFQIEMA